MSLCHGPGCRREAVVEFFCGERCQMAWDARWGKRLPDEVTFGGALRVVIRTELDRSQIEAAIAEQVPQPGGIAMGDLLDRISQVVPVEVPEPFKLTREQLGAIRTASPSYPEYARPSALFGVPVVLVDTVEESTPFQRAFPDAPEVAAEGAESSQVASEYPQVARGWLGRWLGRMFGKDHT